MKLKNMVFPPSYIILPLHVKAITKVVTATSTPSHRSNLSCQDRRILSFIDVEVEERIENVSDKHE